MWSAANRWKIESNGINKDRASGREVEKEEKESEIIVFHLFGELDSAHL